MINRRHFLKQSSLVALAPSIPAFLARSARAEEIRSANRVLVVIQLDGGNDGINTIVPYADEGYAQNREKLRIREDRLLKIDDSVAFHPALRSAAELLEDGRLNIIPGVGYPNPNRSHDVSMAIWHTARFDESEHNSFGWIGRGLDQRAVSHTGAPSVVLLGNAAPPVAVRGRRTVSVALNQLEDLELAADGWRPPGRSATAQADDDLAAFVRRSTLDAYATSELLEEAVERVSADNVRYPDTGLARRLKLVAQLIKAEVETPVYYTLQTGYDTHYLQMPAHEPLLAELGSALKAFLNDLQTGGMQDRVAVLCFSEFGRRVKENKSQGTDHGTAGPVFLAGGKVRPGLHAKMPSLTDLEEGDLKMSVDFRSVYAAVLQDWLGVPMEASLGGRFTPLPLFQRS